LALTYNDAFMQISWFQQGASFTGAVLILVAYVGHQLGWMSARQRAYNLLNVVGSGILAYVAFHPFQAGFVVLEVTWVLISVWALWRSASA